MRILFYICFSLWAFIETSYAQSAGRDSVKALSFGVYLDLVAQNHPVALQARLLSEQAKQEIRMARGAFDPKLAGSYDRKDYMGKNYFIQEDYGLKAPVWIGEFKAGLERNRGSFLNPASRTPTDGLLYAGYKAPLGQGLFMDAARAALGQAQAMQGMAEAEQVKIINKLLLSAAKSYWNWYFAFQELENTRDFYRLGKERFDFLKIRAEIGEVATFDTVEALINLQDRFVLLQDAQVQFKNSVLELSTFIWEKGESPLELSETVRPSVTPQEMRTIEEPAMLTLMDRAKTQHPEIRKLNFKISQLEYDRRLAAENFKPVFNITGTAITRSGGPLILGENEGFGTNAAQNFKLGIEFQMPLFLRKERGKLGLTKAKISQTELDRLQTNREIQNEIQAVYNSMRTLERQLEVQQQLAQNYSRLRDAEINRFNIGESSIFLVNAREAKLIEARIKVAKQVANYQKAKAELLWAAGVADWNAIK